MASVKQRKGKGRALDLSWSPGAGLSAYFLRKAAFASLPPAKVVKPVRYLRRLFDEALKVWQREINDAVERGKTVPGADEVCIPFPHREEQNYLLGQRLNGAPMVHWLAQRLV